MTIRAWAGVACLAASTAACDKIASALQGAQAPVATPAPAEMTVPTVIQKELSNLRLQVFRLSQRVGALESGAAMVSSEEQGYGIAKTNFGPFTVQVASVTPYLDGYRVKLRIGNLTSANFKGAKVKVDWGPLESSDEKEAENFRNKELDVTNTFPAGTLTTLDVVLTPARPKDIKVIFVNLTLNEMSLHIKR